MERAKVFRGKVRSICGGILSMHVCICRSIAAVQASCECGLSCPGELAGYDTLMHMHVGNGSFEQKVSNFGCSRGSLGRIAKFGSATHF